MTAPARWLERLEAAGNFTRWVGRRTHPSETQRRLYDRLAPALRLVDRLTGPSFGRSLSAAARRADAGLNVGADL